VKDALDHGANVLCGGKLEEKLGPLFYSPTILIDVNEKMKIFTEETFGPVMIVVPFDSDDHVIKMVKPKLRANLTIIKGKWNRIWFGL